ncbi:exopolysaccharide biosynthesis protein [Salipiger sp. PrR007]|uniref:exopolysaccharide biosynthesis protein n=1 Tax=Salipiger sp. PrR007 TaxID=2706884 RepID=UPI0013B66742|nr:exopolysaccharide biosynthesis protein [Salipiger sp. PrR007]NDW33430.1 exopolysaccharide biosynthesis protein [Salipiger sp. PrR007]
MMHLPRPKVPLSALLLGHSTGAGLPPAKAAAERLSVGDLMHLLAGRSGAALMLVFALPNVVPMPPGVSGLLGWPLVYLSWQLMLRRPPRLPRTVLQRSTSAAGFRAILARMVPLLQRAERLLRPRLPLMTTPLVLRAAGAVCLGLSVILLLPIPLGNILPALAISLFALGLLERDGLCLLLGFAVAGVSVALVWGVLWTLLKAVALLWPL